jgi:hypothetical protein
MKGKKTGGRLPGSLNKKNATLEERAEKLQCDPFEILLKFANGDWEGLGYQNECYFRESKDGQESITLGYTIPPDLRLKAASEASKYLFTQKKALQIDSNVTVNNPFTKMTLEEKLEKAKEVTELLLIQGEKK